MICTKLKYIETYKGIDANLDKAIDYLINTDLSTLNLGRNEVDGDRVYINRFQYQTIPEEEGIFEAHEKHLDIHLLLSGRERMGIGDIDRMTVKEKDIENDGILYDGPIEQQIHLEPGDALIAFPHDAHMVKLESSGISSVDKIVVKVLLQ